MLPFGYVAHDQAADPANPLQTAVTVGSDGIVREIAVTWGSVDVLRHVQQARRDCSPEGAGQRAGPAARTQAAPAKLSEDGEPGSALAGPAGLPSADD